MSQCCSRKRRFALIQLLLLSGVLSACSMAELERFATEASAEQGAAGSAGGSSAPAAGTYLTPDHIIKGGKQEMGGALGTFARMLVGEGDEIRFMKPVALAGQQEFLFIVDADARVVFKYNLETQTIAPIGNVGVQFIGRPGNIFVTRDL